MDGFTMWISQFKLEALQKVNIRLGRLQHCLLGFAKDLNDIS